MRKVRLSDPVEAAQLAATGGQLLADYGSFQLWRAPLTTPVLANRLHTISAENFDVIELNAGPLDTSTVVGTAAKQTLGRFPGQRLHLVQFLGPIKPEWLATLEATGVRVVHYVPQNAYLVRGDAPALAAVQALARAVDYVQWEGEYADPYKLHPRTQTAVAAAFSASSAAWYAVQLVEDAAANAATFALLAQWQSAAPRQEYRLLGYVNLLAQLTAAQVTELAAQPEVVSIRPHVARKRRDERQGQILAGNLAGNVPSDPGYLAWLTSKGFTQEQFDASGFVVDVTDSGLDNGSLSPGHFGLYRTGQPAAGARVAYARLEGTANAGSTIAGCDGHGNLNAHIIGGFNDLSGFPHVDAAGYRYGLGICPFVKVGSSVVFDTSNFTDPNYPNLAARAYRDGARVSNNSWGADTGGDYDADSQAYDALVRDAQPAGAAVATAGNQQMVFCFAAGNAGSSAGTVGSPGTAKNVIVVGAAENVHPHNAANGGNSSTGNDGCSTPDSEANSANDIAIFSSRGPCADGRQKPDLVAPGTHVTGGVAQSVLTTSGTGTALSCFDGSGVCGLTGGGTVGSANNFFPLGQQFYSTSSGTSHSTPAVAGAAALLRQYFLNASLAVPSPAMTKAFLVNSARYLTGTSAGDQLPSPHQGMGGVNLGMAFDGVVRVLRDQEPADKFTATGQTRTFRGLVVDPAKPFRVTLAWTDAPGSTTGNAYNNNLDLTVTVGGVTYRGNVFTSGTGLSISGGMADGRNNLESVFLPAGSTGPFQVTVVAANINSDGVPNEAPGLDQDFALVVYNAEESTAALPAADGYAVVTESCTAPNQAIDPGETVTVNFAFRNLGSASTTNLVVTLRATNGVSNPSGPQVYGALPAAGPAVTQPFTFTALGSCGGSLAATFALSDGDSNYPPVTVNLPLGQFAPVYGQNFDSGNVPQLPGSWSTTVFGAQSAWITSPSAADTLPNAAYTAAATSTGESALISPVYALFPGPTQLSFRHRYSFETSYDGGVLEIKIGAGAFMDLITAGGSFSSGGYNGAVGTGNALGARSAWTGTNNNFTTVIANLPPSAAGQAVQFRWRSGTDSSMGGGGWWVDSVAISATICCGVGYAPIILAQPQSTTVSAGEAASFAVQAIGDAPLVYQWYREQTPVLDATNNTLTLAAVTAGAAGNYQVVITNASGSVTSSVALLTVITTPLITVPPASLTVLTGSVVHFSVTAIGAVPLTFQWRQHGVDLPAATNTTLPLSNVGPAASGSYTVVVTNYAGAVTSAPAVLTVTEGVAAQPVISQFYGGGGNSGATYRNDYVELFNPGSLPASVSGWSVQYASATGSSWQMGALQGSIPAGGYFLVQLASGGANGALLPVANATNNINISASNGKLALVSNQTPLSGANPVGGLAIADFVGFGTAGAYEGTGAAPGGDNSTAILRRNNGATDTGDNAADFLSGPPNPRANAATNPPVLSYDAGLQLTHSGDFQQGDSARNYTVIVTNSGSLTLTGVVTVTLSLPASLTATALTGSGWSSSLSPLQATRADPLNSGLAFPALLLTVTVASNAPGLVTNLAVLTLENDANAANNVATDVTTILPLSSGGGTGSNLLAGWDVSGQSAYGLSPLAPTTNAAQVLVVGLTRGAGVTTTPTAASRAWGGNGFNATSETAALTAGDVITWGVSAAPGYRLSLGAVGRFDYRRSSSGPAQGTLQYQVGAAGFVTVTNLSYSATASSGASLGPIDLSGISVLQDLDASRTVTFRVINWGASSAGGNWYVFDVANSSALDLTVLGRVTPELGLPATPPELALVHLSGAQLQFTLTGTAGSNYVIEASASLFNPVWSPVYTGSAPFLFHETATNQQRYYRGVVAP
jgi:hypothetical protein